LGKHRDLFGSIIAKEIKLPGGRIVDSSCTDSALVIKLDNSIDVMPVQKIAYIKTKHSIGNNILIGALTFAPVGGVLVQRVAVLKIHSEKRTTQCSHIRRSSRSRRISGRGCRRATIGAITGVFKNSKKITINGEPEKWREARNRLSN